MGFDTWMKAVEDEFGVYVEWSKHEQFAERVLPRQGYQ
jgi:hypothetical protein